MRFALIICKVGAAIRYAVTMAGAYEGEDKVLNESGEESADSVLGYKLASIYRGDFISGLILDAEIFI